jgi:hypothetical protein
MSNGNSSSLNTHSARCDALDEVVWLVSSDDDRCLATEFQARVVPLCCGGASSPDAQCRHHHHYNYYYYKYFHSLREYARERQRHHGVCYTRLLSINAKANDETRGALATLTEHHRRIALGYTAMSVLLTERLGPGSSIIMHPSHPLLHALFFFRPTA